MHTRIRIVTDANSSHDLIAMFSASFAKLSESGRKYAPTVVTA